MSNLLTILSFQTRKFNDFAVNGLGSRIRYEVLVCFENVTAQFLETNYNDGFIKECGYCRTCFRSSLLAGRDSYFNSSLATTYKYEFIR